MPCAEVKGRKLTSPCVPLLACILAPATGRVAANVAVGGPVPRLGLIEVIAIVFASTVVAGQNRALRYDHARARHTGLHLAAASRRSSPSRGR